MSSYMSWVLMLTHTQRGNGIPHKPDRQMLYNHQGEIISNNNKNITPLHLIFTPLCYIRTFIHNSQLCLCPSDVQIENHLRKEVLQHRKKEKLTKNTQSWHNIQSTQNTTPSGTLQCLQKSTDTAGMKMITLLFLCFLIGIYNTISNSLKVALLLLSCESSWLLLL